MIEIFQIIFTAFKSFIIEPINVIITVVTFYPLIKNIPLSKIRSFLLRNKQVIDEGFSVLLFLSFISLFACGVALLTITYIGVSNEGMLTLLCFFEAYIIWEMYDRNRSKQVA